MLGCQGLIKSLTHSCALFALLLSLCLGWIGCQWRNSLLFGKNETLLSSTLGAGYQMPRAATRDRHHAHAVSAPSPLAYSLIASLF